MRLPSLRRVRVVKGAVFRSNRTQAIGLPKAVELPDDVKRVDVVALGRTRIITPDGQSWDSWFDNNDVTSDYMTQREQPVVLKREVR
ncbi:type II toxin-antitoxin system VapB family antitoxin [Achromobacter spanius]|uniref:type II toxin-antitoxin system VapB family antitoxin n=1 Tax=Achromobacter spanius TaxID=217203 RepID=UPI0013E02EA8|nr:type II toxin-antitoxin system VapB family antitoxin [Achromobacter spanius]